MSCPKKNWNRQTQIYLHMANLSLFSLLKVICLVKSKEVAKATAKSILIDSNCMTQDLKINASMKCDINKWYIKYVYFNETFP